MKDKEKETNIVINNEIEFMTLKHNEKLSHTFDKIKMDSLHIRNVNFNLLEIQMLQKLSFKNLSIENCILGNLHHIDFNRCNNVSLINQHIDDYFMNSAYNRLYYPSILHLEKIKTYTLSFLSNNTYEDLFIKNSNIKGILHTLNKIRITNLYLDDINSYSISDLEYLKEKMNEKRIIKVMFNDSQIDANKIFFIERKLKIEKLIKENA